MKTLRTESAVNVLGVDSRAFAVIAEDSGRIRKQTIKATRHYTESGRKYRITAEMRFDDELKNGHETFAITADIRESDGAYWREYAGGCCHDEIARQFPEWEPLIKWHLCSTDGPMHYIANTMYHADEHGPTHAWVYFTGASDPLGIEGKKERLLGYVKAAEALAAECPPGYCVQWDERTTKAANFDHARSTAVWPEATIEQLRSKAELEARLPALLDAFKVAMLSAGFLYPELIEQAP